ncbi:MAG: 5-dehydro-4-deoxy-D-glucuronate isomerase [Reichenbachiella sp.]
MNNYTIVDERFSSHPRDFQAYGTERLREEFLINTVFEENKIRLTYTHYDRFIAGGIVPVNQDLYLEAIDQLKAESFCDRREVGVINIGGNGIIIVDGTDYEINYRDALYIPKDTKSIVFKSKDSSKPAKFYLTSAPAHKEFPLRKISKEDVVILDLGCQEDANERQIFQYIVAATCETCQLQMGFTALKTGNVWNTMPPHTHTRRMEVYFYTELKESAAISHYMGDKDNTRVIWMKNNQAVISPSWSIHSAVGTSNYIFIWGMAGENLDFTDMDGIKPTELR